VWDGFAAKGAVSLLSAKPKVGKTTLLFAFMGAAKRGGTCGGANVAPARVLYLTEEGLHTLREKCERFLPDGCDHVEVLQRRQRGVWNLTWEDIVTTLGARLLESPVDVLIIDTWDKWADLHGNDENQAGSINQRMAPLLALAEAGIAVIVVAHDRKGGGSHGDQVRGGNALTGSVDVVMSMDRVDGIPDARSIKAIGRFAQTPDEALFRLTGGSAVAIGSVKDARTTVKAEAVAERIKDQGPLTVEQYISLPTVSVASNQAKKDLDAAANLGLLTRTGSGRKGDPHRYGLFSSPSLREEEENNQTAIPATANTMHDPWSDSA
jgi:predicted ATP-dependent serine protease